MVVSLLTQMRCGNIASMTTGWVMAGHVKTSRRSRFLGYKYGLFPFHCSILTIAKTAGTYTQVYNAQATQDSALEPFRTDDGKYWTSNQARYLTSSAYKKCECIAQIMMRA